MSRKEKFYLSRGLRRAGKPVEIHKGSFCVLWIQRSTNRARLMAHTDTLVITRDGYAYPKAFAGVMSLCPSEMHVYYCTIEEGYQLAQSIEHQISDRNRIMMKSPSVFTVPAHYAIPRTLQNRRIFRPNPSSKGISNVARPTP